MSITSQASSSSYHVEKTRTQRALTASLTKQIHILYARISKATGKDMSLPPLFLEETCRVELQTDHANVSNYAYQSFQHNKRLYDSEQHRLTTTLPEPLSLEDRKRKKKEKEKRKKDKKKKNTKLSLVLSIVVLPKPEEAEIWALQTLIEGLEDEVLEAIKTLLKIIDAEVYGEPVGELLSIARCFTNECTHHPHWRMAPKMDGQGKLAWEPTTELISPPQAPTESSRWTEIQQRQAQQQIHRHTPGLPTGQRRLPSPSQPPPYTTRRDSSHFDFAKAVHAPVFTPTAVPGSTKGSNDRHAKSWPPPSPGPPPLHFLFGEAGAVSGTSQYVARMANGCCGVVLRAPHTENCGCLEDVARRNEEFIKSHPPWRPGMVD